eukprot:TRINITY_DN787_c0_g1_i1.p3 TRINITY_DN787_c0_g1~~TRINITY_DN787_c0_g1_i1.p3  ORF type:complete len:562 (+),score=95.10 TRINITY_DN787_c0_g1_i1:181-1866(+)
MRIESIESKMAPHESYEKPAALKEEYKPAADWYMNKPIQECFSNPGTVVFPLAHESMGWAYSDFQDYLLGEVFQEKDTKYKTRKVDVFPENTSVMAPIKLDLEKLKLAEVASIANYYKEKPEEFKAVRFALVKCVLPGEGSIENMSTGAGSSMAEEIMEALNADKFKFLNSLKELVLIAYERCVNFTNQFRKSHDTKDATELIHKYADFWRNYIRTALELEKHLSPLAEAMNEITGIVLNSKEFPKFRIYRLLVEVFIRHCYKPLKDLLFNQFVKYLETVNTMRFHYQAIQLIKEVTTEKLDTFLGGISLYQMTSGNITKNTYQLSQCIKGILDMYVNEINVHYIRTRRFIKDTSNSAGLEDLVQNIAGVFKIITEKISEKTEMLCKEGLISIEKKKEVKEELINDIVNQYQQLFPPSLLKEVEDKRKEIVLAPIKEEIKEKLEEYRELEPELKEAFLDQPEEEEESKTLTDFLVDIKKSQSGFPNEEIVKFRGFLKEECNELCEKLAEEDERDFMAEYVDESLEERNKGLGLSLSEDSDRVYYMGGMSKSIQDNVTQQRH